jgi:prophage tail gpP-like protein
MKRLATNNDLEFMSGSIPLALNDLARQNDVLEVKNGKAVVLEFVCRMDGDEVVPGPYQSAQQGDRKRRHDLSILHTLLWRSNVQVKRRAQRVRLNLVLG